MLFTAILLINMVIALQDSFGSDADGTDMSTSKKGGKMKRKRATTVTCLLLDKYQKAVPKGYTRKALEDGGKIKRLYVSKDTSHREVKEKIFVTL